MLNPLAENTGRQYNLSLYFSIAVLSGRASEECPLLDFELVFVLTPFYLYLIPQFPHYCDKLVVTFNNASMAKITLQH